MNERQRDFRAQMLVLGFSALVFFAQTAHFHLLFDGLTYAALAKNILKTGDWIRLHYGLEHYPDFYQHPPLAIWMQALIYQVFGFSEAISRLLPGALAIGTTLGVYRAVKRVVGIESGLVAALVLLSSTRFVKWGSNFYLDGPMTAFLFFGFYLWTRPGGVTFKGSVGAGFFFALAFMTKGVAAAPVIAVALVLSLLVGMKRVPVAWGGWALGAALPLGLWMAFGAGTSYLSEYFSRSVAGRVDHAHFSIHPWRNLYLLWWPWLGFFIWGLVKGLRRETLPWVLAALSIPFAYSLGSIYMEHYLTPFYPFAAVFIGITLGPRVRALGARGQGILNGVFVGLALLIATIAPDLNPMKRFPADEWISDLHQIEPKLKMPIDRIFFTEAAGDLWGNLAAILARSDWQSVGAVGLDRIPQPGAVFVTGPHESPKDPGWYLLTCLGAGKYRYFTAIRFELCP